MKRLSLCTAAVFALSICVSVSAQNKNETTLPTILNVPAPEYPQAAKDAGIGGDVYVLLLIDKKGRIKVVDYYGPIAPCSNLDDPLTASVQAAAVEASKKATFAPATYNGKAVEKGFRLKYYFDPKEGRGSAPGDQTSTVNTDAHVDPPVALKIPKAHYPQVFGQIGGLVTVRMIVYEDGLVHYAGAISGHRELRRPAVEAACRSIFRPAMRDGKPTKFEFTIEHNFYNIFERG